MVQLKEQAMPDHTGDQPWQSGTTYGSIGGPIGPAIALQMVRGTSCSCHEWSGGTDFWGTSYSMTEYVLTEEIKTQ